MCAGGSLFVAGLAGGAGATAELPEFRVLVVSNARPGT